MNSDKLMAIGLTRPQAQAYALLIERGEITPPEAANTLKLTRTNAYKLLDKLAELGLAKKVRGQKALYKLNNPLALATHVARYRAEAVAREEAVNSVMNSLLASYYKHTEQPAVEIVSGKQAVADAYRKQIGLKEDICFIHTPADVATMGFDAMHEIRVAPARHGKQRHGILKAPADGKANWESHKRSNLNITWMPREAYDAPVEWSVTKSSLMIILFANEPHAVTIADPIISGAFLQLFKMLSSLLEQQPNYKINTKN